MVDVSKGRKIKNAAAVHYSYLSSIALIPHCSKYYLPVAPAPSKIQEKYSDEEQEMGVWNLDYLPKVPERVHIPNQKEGNDLVRDMGLIKFNAELFIS